MSLIPFFGHRDSPFCDPFSLNVWDPFYDFNHESMLPASSHIRTGFSGGRIEWDETPEAHVIRAELPGLKKEEVKVQVEDGRVLKISGERKVEKEDKHDKWHRFERSSGKFLSAFTLPENSRADRVKSSMENGVLTITVPKQEMKQSHARKVDIKG